MSRFEVRVRPATIGDASDWLRMRIALWPDGADDHRQEIDRFFAGDRHLPTAVLLAVDAAGAPVGFVELSIRNIVDGCATDRVGYLEGWYVDPPVRRQGIGAALVAAAERWAAEAGCREFASDALADNDASRAAHLALGFEETGAVRNFKKDLPVATRVKMTLRSLPGLGEPLRCSFCNKRQGEVQKLIAGPTVFICDECVGICVDIIQSDQVPAPAIVEPPLVPVLAPSTRITKCRMCDMAIPWEEALEVPERGFMCPGCVGEVEAALALRRLEQ